MAALRVYSQVRGEESIDHAVVRLGPVEFRQVPCAFYCRAGRLRQPLRERLAMLRKASARISRELGRVPGLSLSVQA